MYQKILVPVELHHDTSWKHTLPLAIETARQNDAELHVMTVAPELEANLRRMGEEQKRELEDFVKKQVPEDVKTTTATRKGSIHREICAEAKKVGADLIVMASQNPKITDRIMGSNASSVVRYAPCSVMVYRVK